MEGMRGKLTVKRRLHSLFDCSNRFTVCYVAVYIYQKYHAVHLKYIVFILSVRKKKYITNGFLGGKTV